MRAWILCVLTLVALGACGDDGATQLPAWDKTLPDSSVFGNGFGLLPARGLVHMHSPYSHDACDGMPRDGSGVPNEPCLGHLRAALCTTKIDYIALTDHDDSMADETFETLFSMRAGDEAVRNGSGEQIASRINCEDGHQVLVMVGSENDLMPVMLDRHVPGTVAERHAIYNGTTPAAITAMRDAGALVWVAHTEQHPIDELRTVVPDGIEVYNLHANLDPNIRKDFLGLPSGDAIANAVEFADTNEGGPEPDLALISFLAPNMPAIERWNQLLADGRKIPATAGSDAHENALPVMLADGERGDSYRRVLRWFGNILLATNPSDPASLKDALRKGQLFTVFEMLGTPEGFSVTAGAGCTLGCTAATGSMLMVMIPRIHGLDASLPAPEIKATVWRIDGSGATALATGEGGGGMIVVPLAAPGAYRVEVSMIPRHLGPYLRDLGTAWADRELPWIYASPIYVQ